MSMASQPCVGGAANNGFATGPCLAVWQDPLVYVTMCRWLPGTGSGDVADHGKMVPLGEGQPPPAADRSGTWC